MLKSKLFAVFAVSSTLTMALQAADLDLEPCINGAVSAMGEFSAQAFEDLSISLNALHEDEYALEPCINGGVSASGSYVSQTAEVEVRDLMASK